MDENKLQHMIWNYEQLRNIVRPDSLEGTEVKAKLKYVEKIITRELPELIKKVAPPNIYELMADFNAEYDKFKDFIIYESLIGKNVIGLGGGFSSGKSSFLNSLMGRDDILPVSINPSTSVPAYLVHGKENIVKAVNIFDVCIELDLFAINEISHGFGAVGEQGENTTAAVPLGHVLKNLFLETPLQKYENLVFLDTPGYSKPDSADYSAKTDENIARQQLNTVDMILWFLPVNEAGSFTDTDISFIKSLDKNIPITVICSKAKRRTKKQRTDIEAKLREQILVDNLNIKDIFFFDTEEPDGLDSKKIYAMFDVWNRKEYEEEIFARHFKRLFWECREFYKKKSEEASAEMRNLKNALLLLEDNGEISVYIERVKANSEKEKVLMAKAEKQMLRMQTEFFKEIKVVADSVGIYMPEPKDIEVLEDKITDPLVILREYNQKHKKTVSKEMKEQILDVFRNINPVFECEPGGSKYKKVEKGQESDIQRIEQIARQSAFNTHFLKECDEDVVAKYCTILASYVRFADNVEKKVKQYYFLSRILYNVSIHTGLEEIITNAGLVDSKDFEMMKQELGSNIKLFVFDILLMISLDEEINEKQLSYFCETLAYANVKKKDMECMLQVCACVLSGREEELYQYASGFPIMEIFCYLRSPIKGGIVISLDAIEETKEKDIIVVGANIKNMELDLDIYGKKSLSFLNCRFKHISSIRGIKTKVTFENCYFKDCRKQQRVKSAASEYICALFSFADAYFKNCSFKRCHHITTNQETTVLLKMDSGKIESCNFISCSVGCAGKKRLKLFWVRYYVWGALICANNVSVKNTKYQGCVVKENEGSGGMYSRDFGARYLHLIYCKGGNIEGCEFLSCVCSGLSKDDIKSYNYLINSIGAMEKENQFIECKADGNVGTAEWEIDR